MNICSTSTPSTVDDTDDSNLDNEDSEEVRVLTIDLLGEDGTEHEFRIDEDDWSAALAQAQDWLVYNHYGKPIVASRAANRRRRKAWTMLSDLIAKPWIGETTRYLDGNSLNLTYPNLVTRPYGARTVPSARGGANVG